MAKTGLTVIEKIMMIIDIRGSQELILGHPAVLFNARNEEGKYERALLGVLGKLRMISNSFEGMGLYLDPLFHLIFAVKPYSINSRGI